MTALAGTLFFLSVFAFSGWVIVATARPRMGRILFLLRYGPVIGADLPGPSRAMVRGRPVRLRVSVPPALRAAA